MSIFFLEGINVEILLFDQLTCCKHAKEINTDEFMSLQIRPSRSQECARGVMVIVTGYGHGDTSSISGQD